MAGPNGQPVHTRTLLQRYETGHLLEQTGESNQTNFKKPSDTGINLEQYKTTDESDPNVDGIVLYEDSDEDSDEDEEEEELDVDFIFDEEDAKKESQS